MNFTSEAIEQTSHNEFVAREVSDKGRCAPKNFGFSKSSAISVVADDTMLGFLTIFFK